MERYKLQNFDDIRPVHDSEVTNVISGLLKDASFRRAVEPLVAPLTWEMFSGAMMSCKTIYEFQRNIIYPFMKQIIAKTTDGVSAVGIDNWKKEESYLFISNYRAID